MLWRLALHREMLVKTLDTPDAGLSDEERASLRRAIDTLKALHLYLVERSLPRPVSIALERPSEAELEGLRRETEAMIAAGWLVEGDVIADLRKELTPPL